MNRRDFLDWKEHPITRAMFDELHIKIRGLETELGMSAGVDTRNDAIKVGAIQAFKDIIDADWFEEDSE